jgi:signal transduction histidine kinase/CheY-like chemotaxis protein
MKTARPLRHHLLLLAAIGLLPLALLGAWVTHDLSEAQRREVERSTLDLSRALASAVESELLNTVSALAGLSDSPALAQDDTRSFYGMSQGAVRARPNWSGIVLTNGEGHVLFRTQLPYGADGGQIVEPQSLTSAIHDMRPVVGNLASGKHRGNLFPVRVPVMRDGTLAYVVTAVLKPDRIVEIIKRQKVPASWVISVFDGNGLRVARSKDHDKTIGTPATPTLAELLQKGGSEGTGVTTSLEGDEIFTGFSKVGDLGWRVAVGVPTQDLQQAVVRSRTTYGLGVLASLAACWLLALYLARRISEPINELRDQAVLLGHGETVSMQPTGIAEVDQMASALVVAAGQRTHAEQERETLLSSLQQTLALAEEAGRAKDGFMAMLGHELRNPLAPIVNSLYLMEMKGDKSTEAERRIIQRQVNHMKRLVDDLLDISRITRGHLEIHSQPVDLRLVIERSIEAVRPLLLGRRSDIKLSLPAAPVWVLGDEGRLIQVVVNLLTNALKFDLEGEVSLTVTARDDEVQIEVRDHGAGMTPEVLASAFKPFYQAPQSLARASGGLGLGLAIVCSIVELHGGHVTAHSDGLGQGSVFTVTLERIDARTGATSPTGPQPLVGRPAATPSDRQPTRGRVLVVDDNVDAADTTAVLLELAGFEVRVANSGTAAFNIFAAFQPHVGVLDIGLPDIDGYDLARAIRAQHGEHDCQLIALTGYGQEADRQQSHEAGFVLHLAKPVDSRKLVEAVQSLVQLNQPGVVR